MDNFRRITIVDQNYAESHAIPASEVVLNDAKITGIYVPYAANYSFDKITSYFYMHPYDSENNDMLDNTYWKQHFNKDFQIKFCNVSIGFAIVNKDSTSTQSGVSSYYYPFNYMRPGVLLPTSMIDRSDKFDIYLGLPDPDATHTSYIGYIDNPDGFVSGTPKQKQYTVAKNVYKNIFNLDATPYLYFPFDITYGDIHVDYFKFIDSSYSSNTWTSLLKWSSTYDTIYFEVKE